MSLEQALAENTAALQELTAALNAGGLKSGGTSAPTPRVAPRAVATKPTVAAKPTAAKPTARPVTKAAPATSDDGIPYEDVKAKILELGAIPETGRAAVTAVLKQFSVAKGPDLLPEQYEEALLLLNQAIEENSEQA